MKKIVAVSVLFLANAAVAQVQVCDLVSPAKQAEFKALHISAQQAIAEYMTAIELIDAENTASQCELPPGEMIRELEIGITWRVAKLAQAQGPKYLRMLAEYSVSGGYETLTAPVAIKWLKHNDLIAKFNAWDAADVRHDYETRTKEVRKQFAPQQNGRPERMHLTLKKEATKPAAANFLQQQARFDQFMDVFNNERPHEALDLKCPAEVYQPSPRPYTGLPDIDYLLHDKTIVVTRCGRICLGKKKINFSQVFAGQAVGF
jgi:hypothetical protein